MAKGKPAIPIKVNIIESIIIILDKSEFYKCLTEVTETQIQTQTFTLGILIFKS